MTSERSLLKFDKRRLKEEAEPKQEEPKTDDKATSSKVGPATLKKVAKPPLLPPINANQADQKDYIQVVLDCLLPPREILIEGKWWLQPVSTCPATRLDVINLEQKLDAMLNERGAKLFGICPVRRMLYDDLFDELVRQVAIHCAERGLMLLRVRDELRMSIFTYQSIFESAVAWGARKAILAEERRDEAAEYVEETKKTNERLVEENKELKQRLEDDARTAEEERKVFAYGKDLQIERLTRSNEQLKHAFDKITKEFARIDDEFLPKICGIKQAEKAIAAEKPE